MTEMELLLEARRMGYQLVPMPPSKTHDLNPGDLLEHEPPKWMQGLARRAEDAAGKGKLFDFTPRRGLVLAVASRADVLVRFTDGKIGFFPAKGLLGEKDTALRKIIDPGAVGPDPTVAALTAAEAVIRTALDGRLDVWPGLREQLIAALSKVQTALATLTGGNVPEGTAPEVR